MILAHFADVREELEESGEDAENDCVHLNEVEEIEEKEEGQEKQQQPMRAPSSSTRVNSSGGTRIYHNFIKRYSHENERLHNLLVEIHDIPMKGGERYWLHFRDLKSRTSCGMPFSFCEALVAHLKLCKNEDGKYAFDRLAPMLLQPATSAHCTVSITNGPSHTDEKLIKVALLAPPQAQECGDGGVIGGDGESGQPLMPDLVKHDGSVLLHERQAPQLVNCLERALLRHSLATPPPSPRMFFSSSAERRFTFKVLNTRYGLRLQICQFTHSYRNVISVPVDDLAVLRDIICHFADGLSLDQCGRQDASAKSGIPSESANVRKEKNTKKVKEGKNNKCSLLNAGDGANGANSGGHSSVKMGARPRGGFDRLPRFGGTLNEKGAN